MNQALESLNLAHLWIIYPESIPIPFKEDIRLASEGYRLAANSATLSLT